MGAAPLLRQSFQQTEGEDFLSEVPPVEGAVKDRLVDLLEFAQGELRGEKAINNIRILELGANPSQGKSPHLIVVIGEARKAIGGEPSDIGILGSRIQADFTMGNQSQIGDGNHPRGGISLRLAEGIELF